MPRSPIVAVARAAFALPYCWAKTRHERNAVADRAAGERVAAGAGASVAMACDIAIAAPGASFIQAFSKIGLVPDSGGTWLLPQRVGLARAMALALTGDKLSAADARAMGMIWDAPESQRLADAPAPPASAPLAAAPAPAEVASAPASAPVAAAPPAFLASWPGDTRLSYKLGGNYRGELHGDARVLWQRDGTRYHTAVELNAGLLVSLSFTSQGEITAEGLVPEVYEETLRGRRRGVRIGADVRLNDGTRVARPAAVQDTASQFVELGHRFSTGAVRLEPGAQVRFSMARPGGVDDWTYDVVGEEVLHLPRLGAVQTEIGQYFRAVNEHNRVEYATLRAPAPQRGVAFYTGVESCHDCHEEAYDVWRGPPHSHAYRTLEEVSKNFNLSCVGCHVTGYRQPGGSEVVQNEGLRDVQCESCHGPGSAHVNARPGAARRATITLRTSGEFCATQCHTPEHSDRFNYDRYLPRILGPGHGRPLDAGVADGGTHDASDAAPSDAGPASDH